MLGRTLLDELKNVGLRKFHVGKCVITEALFGKKRCVGNYNDDCDYY